MSGVERDGLVESGEDTGDLFVREERGEGEAGMIIDRDVETLDAGAWVAEGAVAGGAHARACEAAQFLDVEVEELARMVAFVADDGGLDWFERREPVEAVAAQDARKRGLGDGEHEKDLGIRAALPAQREDLGFELGAGLARLMVGDRRVIEKTLGKVGSFGAREPAADSLFTDAESEGRVAQRETEFDVRARHLGSRERSESGISVHVVRAGGHWVECSSTTSLPCPFRADNLLKHDT